MMKLRLLVLTPPLLCLFLLSDVSSAQTKYSGPKQLGPFSIAEPTYDEAVRVSRKLFRELGKPAKRFSDFEPYCYRSEDGKTFLKVTTVHSDPTIADSVLLSDFPNCAHVPVKVTHVNLRMWHTKENIRLGSGEKEVLSAYGKGEARDVLKDERSIGTLISGHRDGDNVPDIGEKSIFYSGDDDDLSMAEFGVRKGKVCSILLSDSE